MKRVIILFILICILTSVGVSAQIVNGKLVDETGQPLPYANVVLLSLPDSAFVTGTVSDEGGSFSLQAEEGNYLVKYHPSDIRPCVSRYLRKI